MLRRLHAPAAAAAVRVRRQRDIIRHKLEAPQLMHDGREELPARMGAPSRMHSATTLARSATSIANISNHQGTMRVPRCARV